MRRIPNLVVLTLVTALAACTAIPRAGQADLRTLRLAATLEPQRYDINVFASPAMGIRMGAYDAVLARDIARPPSPGSNDALFTATLKSRANLQLAAELDRDVARALQARGIALARDGQEADATLVIALLYAGYVDQPLRPYTPFLLLEVRLVAQGGANPLFRQRYAYSRLPYQHDDVRIHPAERFTVESEARLLGDIDLAAAGLRAALPAIAADLAQRLAPAR
jgi:hypothetical protein